MGLLPDAKCWKSLRAAVVGSPWEHVEAAAVLDGFAR